MADMNFLPEDYLKKRIERRTNVICLTLFLIMLVAIVGAFLVTNQQWAEVRQQQREINVQFTEAANRLAQLEQLQNRKRDMVRKARITAQLVEQIPRSLILSELINNMPNALSLFNLELETKVSRQWSSRGSTVLEAVRQNRKKNARGAAPEEPVITSKVNISLEGVAPTDVEVAQFMHALGRCVLFRDIRLSFSEQITMERKKLRKFEIAMLLNQEIDVREIEPKQVWRLKLNPMGPRITIGPDGMPLVPSGQGAAVAVSGRRR